MEFVETCCDKSKIREPSGAEMLLRISISRCEGCRPMELTLSVEQTSLTISRKATATVPPINQRQKCRDTVVFQMGCLEVFCLKCQTTLVFGHLVPLDNFLPRMSKRGRLHGLSLNSLRSNQ